VTQAPAQQGQLVSRHLCLQATVDKHLMSPERRRYLFVGCCDTFTSCPDNERELSGASLLWSVQMVDAVCYIVMSWAIHSWDCGVADIPQQ
jgi:hypothetical protein